MGDPGPARDVIHLPSPLRSDMSPLHESCHPAGRHDERRQLDVISDHALCFALEGIASIGVVNQ